MIYKNIMVAYDGSEPAQEALIMAKNMIGDDESATMHVVSIVTIGNGGAASGSTVQPMMNVSEFFPDMETYENMLAEAKSSTIENIKESVLSVLDDVECNVRLEAHIATKPAEGICEYAKDNSIDMIVMGRRGLNAFRAMLGSVSYAVLHEADVPVVTVK